jgi:hypothetical protein
MRVRFCKAGYKQRQQVGRKRGYYPNLKLAVYHAFFGIQHFQQPVALSQYFARLFNYFNAGGCGQHGLLAAVKNFGAQLVFQFVHLHAKRWLGNKAFFCRLGKMPAGVNSHYVFQLCKCHLINFVYRIIKLIDFMNEKMY